MTVDRVTEVLDRLAPVQPFVADWGDVIRRAGGPGVRRLPRGATRARARWLVAVALTAAILVPIGALAASRDWWFFAARAPAPNSTPVVVKSGVWDGKGWELVAYRSTSGKLCFSMNPAGSARTNGAGAALSCGGFEPAAKPDAAEHGPQGITFLTGSGPQLAPYVVGPVVEDAAKVVISLADGSMIRTPTFEAPASLGVVRFYAAPLPATASVRSGHWAVERVAGLDRHGSVVACLAPSTSGRC